jgi:fructose-bisphosphate aldolase class II
LAAAKKAAAGIVKARFEVFGCAGPAQRIRPVNRDSMAARYTK